ncbi:NADP-dependent malic enzyme [Sphingobacteriales bacterium UPWRP_1]|nr:NAD-dependent malic enzyme [Sphingobacteriales bacterium TSM_CSS]PSJ77675.1 NADP-dependent malic enzyme [Sphingobacteriales bacterium UPWRP_1]
MEKINRESLLLHQKLGGKISVIPKMDIETTRDLSLLYSPGVAEPCLQIAANPDEVWKYTIKNNTVAVVSDGSAVLGLGNIGALAAIPVMEGKAMLFKKFAGIDAFPICLNTQDTDEIVQTVKNIAPVFGGINLEDISAPRCFEIEARLQDIGIPVFHDDQHGTAVVALAGLINSCKVLGKNLEDLKVVINGSGAAGVAIARLLRCVSNNNEACIPVKSVLMADTKGIIHRGRTDLNGIKQEVLRYTNPYNETGSLQDALHNADVFIGVSVGNLLTPADIRLMADNAVVFALANPTPEIMPDDAFAGGAAIVGTGRSDFPNQINNVLGFPGIFRGALNARAKTITAHMKLAAAYAIAGCVSNPTAQQVIPSVLDERVVAAVTQAVEMAANEEPVVVW